MTVVNEFFNNNHSEEVNTNQPNSYKIDELRTVVCKLKNLLLVSNRPVVIDALRLVVM